MNDSEKQVGGHHYKDMEIQPIQFVNANKMQFAEGNVIKYVSRHAKCNGKEDLLKAIHYIEMIIERDYSLGDEIKKFVKTCKAAVEISDDIKHSFKDDPTLAKMLGTNDIDCRTEEKEEVLKISRFIKYGSDEDFQAALDSWSGVFYQSDFMHKAEQKKWFERLELENTCGYTTAPLDVQHFIAENQEEWHHQWTKFSLLIRFGKAWLQDAINEKPVKLRRFFVRNSEEYSSADVKIIVGQMSNARARKSNGF